MQYACPNPGCSAVYNLSPQHVGRSLTCKKCGAALLVTENGFQLAYAAGAAPAAQPAEAAPVALPALAAEAEPAYAPRQGSSLLDRGTGFWSTLNRIADIPTWLFGAGTFLIIVYLFFPLIDQAKVARREALIIEGDLREKRLEAEFKKKEKPSSDDEERRKRAREKWEKDKSDLEEDVEAAEVSRRRATYWYRYGMMLGFVLLAIGSLGYVQPSQPPIRRVIGCIVLLAMILIIFSSFTGFGIRFSAGSG